MFSLENPAVHLYAIAASVLGIHLLLLALWTGTVRAQRKTFVNPEDAKLNKSTPVEEDHPDVLRVKRAHMNAIENDIPFFVIGLLYALTAPSRTGALAYFGVFVATRLLHTAFYLAGRQPFRTMMFVLGLLATVGMGVHVIRFAL
jgi:glutathione S-transferase